MTRVGFTGRRSDLTPAQRSALGALWSALRDASPTACELHHGDCVGADAQAHAAWTEGAPERPVVIHPPKESQWRAWCTSPGTTVLRERPFLARNRHLVDATDVLCACPREPEGESLRSGVWASVRYARSLGRPVAIVRPDGRVERERWDALPPPAHP